MHRGMGDGRPPCPASIYHSKTILFPDRKGGKAISSGLKRFFFIGDFHIFVWTKMWVNHLVPTVAQMPKWLKRVKSSPTKWDCFQKICGRKTAIPHRKAQPIADLYKILG